jgi:hypothetical protein
MKPKRVKPVRAWAVLHERGIQIFKREADAKDCAAILSLFNVKSTIVSVKKRKGKQS